MFAISCSLASFVSGLSKVLRHLILLLRPPTSAFPPSANNGSRGRKEHQFLELPLPPFPLSSTGPTSSVRCCCRKRRGPFRLYSRKRKGRRRGTKSVFLAAPLSSPMLKAGRRGKVWDEKRGWIWSSSDSLLFLPGPHHDLISTPFLSLSSFFYSIYNSQSPLRRWLRGRRPAAGPPRRDRGEPGVEVRKSTDNLQKKFHLYL